MLNWFLTKIFRQDQDRYILSVIKYLHITERCLKLMFTAYYSSDNKQRERIEERVKDLLAERQRYKWFLSRGMNAKDREAPKQ